MKDVEIGFKRALGFFLALFMLLFLIKTILMGYTYYTGKTISFITFFE